MPATSRRRPTTRKGRPVLTREAIAAKALEMAGANGFRAVTMRALAAELGVTVRALYNYVEDRQDVVDLALGLMLDSWPPPPLHPAAWEESVAGYADSLRELYRRWPRALLVPLDEEAPPTSVHPNRLLNPDRFLQLLSGIGLGLPAALEVHRHLSLLVLSFALVVDRPAAHATTDRGTLVPDTWLAAHADLDIPALRQAAALPLPTTDAQFDQLVSVVIAQIRSHLDASTQGPTSPEAG
ncbi:MULTISPECIES: TetR/AcrR family transcriptional regulator [Streptomyces]|uniref:TetR/AcrR family transcriptional regulator n=1 Tax=Streptomyces TaxID=1883 RepID=UPI0003A7D1F1|nr:MULTISPECIES: TetR/AcrR family transcriptional regulator [Streptomyces]MBZ6114245.1 TetR/AcrR family transcriptional regulator [Streptomyces olivaceus]MBZ6128799.1 TetR/AcrR family transcriptional regulator [Streptomyces olivaceus]MBZ6148807.1 TetR/AcrR family transcriptional regulator [Streptomyces olivaceus]MBZ6163472.1 TetR/AcrR family transcriptional regulator [Streptomyces olivaceus]MBZ6191259.1 TetR/AcrR family transcriptional regulator [Streptomyces olivaceus]